MGNRVDLAISRLLNQFSASPRIIDLLTTIVTRLEEVDDLLASLATLRWLDTAEGVWLDDIGEIIGIPRFFGEHEGPFFTYKAAYPGVDDPDLAYSGPLPAAPTGGRYQSVFGIENDTPLSDDDYRRWIKAKAKTTGTAGTLRDIWVFVNEALELTDHVVETVDTRLIQITTTAPLTSWKQGKIRQWAPINAGINLAFTT
jgi:hypothetical protein